MVQCPAHIVITAFVLAWHQVYAAYFFFFSLFILSTTPRDTCYYEHSHFIDRDQKVVVLPVITQPLADREGQPGQPDSRA